MVVVYGFDFCHFTREICEMQQLHFHQQPNSGAGGEQCGAILELSLIFGGAGSAFYVARDLTGTIRLLDNKHVFTAPHI